MIASKLLCYNCFFGVLGIKIFTKLSKIRLNSCRIDIYIYEGIKQVMTFFPSNGEKVDYIADMHPEYIDYAYLLVRSK